MTRYRVKIDMENVRQRLSRGMGTEVREEEVVAWLHMAGIHREFPLSPLCWVAGEDSLDMLQPWEILERLPLVILPEQGPGVAAAM